MKKLLQLVAAIALVAAGLCVPATAFAQTCPGGSVSLSTNQNWQSIVDANPGSVGSPVTFCLANGTYQGWKVKPRNYQTFIAQNRHQAILDGGGNTTQAFTSMQAPQSADNRINVTLDGLIIQNYRLPNPNPSAKDTGAVEAGAGWRLQNMIFRNNDSAVVFSKENHDCAQNAFVTNSRFESNSWRAMAWNGTQGTFTGNTFINNGWSAPVANNTDFGRWDGAIKITNQGEWNAGFTAFIACPTVSNGIYIAYNTSVYNRPMGWWHDINVRDFIVEYNYFAFNDWAGIAVEIGGNGIIRKNTFLCNRSRMNIGSGGWGGAEIWNITSSSTVIEDNDVTVCGAGTSYTIQGVSYTTNRPGHGIMIFAEGRNGLSTNNNVVRNNRVSRQGASEALASNIWYGGGFSGNTWTGNVYYQTSGSLNLWQIDNNASSGSGESLGTFSTWQGAGRDTAGSVNSGGSPGNTTPTPGPTNTPGATYTPSPTPTNTPAACSSGPYNGVASSVPGVVQAENFDCGASGYNDITAGNSANSFYYRTTDVDIKPSPYGGFTIGWFETSEWLLYTLNVTQSGYYNVSVYGGTNDLTGTGDKRIQIEIPNGTVRANNITMTQTGNWDIYDITDLNDEAVLGSLYLPSGSTTMRILMVEGYADVDYVNFTFVTGATASPTPTQTPSVTPTPSATFTPSVTPTPSSTPSPAPTYTPLPTVNVPAAISTAIAAYDAAANAFATTDASYSAGLQAIATQRAQTVLIQQTRAWEGATLSAADRAVDDAVSTATAP